MGHTTITALAGLMTLGVVSACAQTTADTPPAATADSATSATPATTATTDSTTSTPAPAPATDQTGTAQQAAPSGNPVPATQADITAGATVNDSAGVMIGTVASVDATGVVLTAGGQNVKLPINSFGKTSAGLMIGTTKADFDAKVAASKAAQPSATQGATPAPSGGTTPPQ